MSFVSGWEAIDMQAVREAACVIYRLSVLGLFGASDMQVKVVHKL